MTELKTSSHMELIVAGGYINLSLVGVGVK
jgi:hypothetical protein